MDCRVALLLLHPLHECIYGHAVNAELSDYANPIIGH